jgi:hypothetical protein
MAVPSLTCFSNSKDIDNTMTDIRKKIDREKTLINGARSMFSQTDNPIVQNRLRSNIHEAERNIKYLEDRLSELELKSRPSQAPVQYTGRPPVPPKDGQMENGRNFDAYGQRWPQPGPGIPEKSRNYTKLGRPQWTKLT